jgi:hypothetical protein
VLQGFGGHGTAHFDSRQSRSYGERCPRPFADLRLCTITDKFAHCLLPVLHQEDAKSISKSTFDVPVHWGIYLHYEKKQGPGCQCPFYVCSVAAVETSGISIVGLRHTHSFIHPHCKIVFIGFVIICLLGSIKVHLVFSSGNRIYCYCYRRVCAFIHSSNR